LTLRPHWSATIPGPAVSNRGAGIKVVGDTSLSGVPVGVPISVTCGFAIWLYDLNAVFNTEKNSTWWVNS